MEKDLSKIDGAGLRAARLDIEKAADALEAGSASRIEDEPSVDAVCDVIDRLTERGEAMAERNKRVATERIEAAQVFAADLENAALAYPDPETEPTTFVVIARCRCVRETPNAILVQDSRGPQWIPKRAVPWNSPVLQVGTQGELYVWTWFARKKWWTP